MHMQLITGPGGAGRTTVAAATATAAARTGRRVLLLSGDPGNPGDPMAGPAAPAGPVTGQTVEAAPGLYAQPVGGVLVARVDSGEEFRAELVALQERGATLLGMLGGRPLGAEELTELPGAEEFALLRALRRAATAPGIDLVVVDMPPLHRTVATLALPAQLRRYLARLLPAERQAARALRPVLAQLAGVPMPAQWLYETAARWDEELAAVQAVVEADTTELRLVAEPGPASDAALRTGRLGLALHQLRVADLVCNRLLPQDSADPWLAGLAAQQEKYAAQWADGLPVVPLRHLGRDPQGPEDLALLAAADGLAPTAPGTTRTAWAVEDRLAEDGVLVWAVPLPRADKRDLDLIRRGDELLLTVGPYRRIVPLPAALRRCTVSGAALADDVLRIRFTPDPGLWPRAR
ncbi:MULTISPECIES: ArsA family ATPase [unclassified Streptomyces]|uniref:ArsA family ATPase n=1 Tax=unclassified Streptomyces TaxID=2593676 RepID=UPI001BE6BE6D|nr:MULTISPECIES: ArsA-related P-loop ATPase [unclassified Streptomyces]MBT2405904.1 ArsA family ATPase [Streptomyces sp. ISL-21]MBT2612278.1 ArsA family ATPase [Streptomyces sp. ISL-87]